MLKVPSELIEDFEEIGARQMALQFKADALSRTLNSEAHAIAVSSKAVWDEAKAVMGLEGHWRYEDGMLHPIVAPIPG